MSSSGANQEKNQIPLEEILRVTDNFSSDTLIGDGGFGMVHRAELITKDGQTRTVAIKRLTPESRQGNPEFQNELDMISSFQHPNIINFIGYCDDPKEKIIVTDYAENGSLDGLLRKPDKMSSLTWAKRLQICLGAAKGLDYLHSGVGDHKRVIHRDVKSANILLDEKDEAKICDFGLSRSGARNDQEDSQIVTRAAGTKYYMDPLYAERSRLTKESDVYSLGVVMFEMSSGRLVYHPKCFGDDTKPQFLMDVVRSCYDDDKKAAKPDKLIDPLLRDHIDMKSFRNFNKIAHQCLSLKLEERPPMVRIIRKIQEALNIQLNRESPSTIRSITTPSLESFLIPRRDIKLATKNFKKKTHIGDYKHGVVHRGQLYERWQNRTMAIRRLSPNSEDRFKRELQMISSFHHQNISPFIGYCDEANQKIIVQEYGVNGDLAGYLENWRTKLPTLTWAQRLKICLGAARGLQYLHLTLGEDNQATRGSINCENILLDENMEAKLSFFGLTTERPTYHKLHEHVPDLFSFGVIMLEMLSGRMASELTRYVEPEYQMDMFQEYYRNNQLDPFIDRSIRDQIDSRCLNILKETAYRCVKRGNQKHMLRTSQGRGRGRGPGVPSGRDTRPPFTMDEVVERIEDAADFQGMKSSTD